MQQEYKHKMKIYSKTILIEKHNPSFLNLNTF